MSRMQSDVREFHLAMGQPAPERPSLDNFDGWLRYDLMHEELCEFDDAFRKWRCAQHGGEQEEAEAEMIDALVDLLYVAFGTAVIMGVNLDPFWEAVHAANMAKLGPDGKPVVREDGKILKPVGWKPPDILGLLRRLKEEQRGG